MAAVACVAFSLFNPNEWAMSDIDNIVIIGNKYYNDRITARQNSVPGEINPDYLFATDLIPRLISKTMSYNRQNVVITVLNETNYNGHIDIDSSSNGFPN